MPVYTTHLLYDRHYHPLRGDTGQIGREQFAGRGWPGFQTRAESGLGREVAGRLGSIFDRQLAVLAGGGQGDVGQPQDTTQLRQLRQQLDRYQVTAAWYQQRIDQHQGQNQRLEQIVSGTGNWRYRAWLQQQIQYNQRLISQWQGRLNHVRQYITAFEQRIAALEGGPSPSPDPMPLPAPGPNPPGTIQLRPADEQMLNSLFAADADGRVREGRHVVVRDGGRADGVLGVGDMVMIVDGRNQTVGSKTLTADDLYALRFREAMRGIAEDLADGGWRFSRNNVDIPGGALRRPETRLFTDDYGVSGTEKVLQRNAYWEVVERNGNRFLLMRQYDDRGNLIRPSDAVRHIFESRQEYRFDCATPMRLLNLKATIDTIGADDFDRRAGRLMINSWFDQHDFSSFDGGFRFSGRTARAGDVTVNGVSNLDGEYALFDPSRGDQLRLGGTYYFDKPGDNTSATQGWNAVFIGMQGADVYRFWTPALGIVDVQFRDGQWIPKRGFKKFYLAAAVGAPDVMRLTNWDIDRSAIA